MENTTDREQKILINELTQGKELTKQLMNLLKPSSSPETQDFLLKRIICSYEKALSVLNCDASLVKQPNFNIKRVESPCSFPNASPRSETSDQECQNKDVFKKRKTMPLWSEQVKVCSGTGLEGPLDDGYCWRKYGQKDILGANHPRGYYRCTHRHAQGCLATKQVQRSDEDPTIFEVTYRGRHTCSQNSHSALASSAPAAKDEAKDKHKLQNQHRQPEQEEKPKQAQEAFSNLGTGIKLVKTEEFDTREDIFPSFTFPQTSAGEENMEDGIFTVLDNGFMGSFSPTFLSPTTSESNYFSMSPCHINSFGLDVNVHTPDSDLSEIISAPNSGTNSPIGDFDFSLVKEDLDPNFSFDNLDYFA